MGPTPSSCDTRALRWSVFAVCSEEGLGRQQLLFCYQVLLPHSKGTKRGGKIVKSEFFCAVRLIWSHILHRDMSKSAKKICKTRSYFEIKPVWHVWRTNVQILHILSKNLRRCASARLQLLGALRGRPNKYQGSVNIALHAGYMQDIFC